MVAPRALVFRPLVKENEDSGNKIIREKMPQYHASLILPTRKATLFAVFVHVLSKLCTLGLKVLELFCTFL